MNAKWHSHQDVSSLCWEYQRKQHDFKRNPRCFDDNVQRLKPGTRLVKTWKEKRHTVLVLANGFEYDGRVYSSLSEIAATITGSRWNGWVFFGIKKHRRNTEAANESAS